MPGTALHWFVFYRAPQVVPQGRIAAFSMSDFSVRRQLWNDRTSIALRVADPFDTMHFSNETDLARYVQRTRRDFSARAVYLTFRWGFGQTPKLRTPVDTQAPQGEPIPGGSGNR